MTLFYYFCKRYFLLLFLLMSVPFLYGFAVGKFQIFPYSLIKFAASDLDTKIQTNYFTDITGRQEVPCPKNATTLVAIGQSNAGNDTSDPQPLFPEGKAVNFWQGRCYLLQDPVLGATNRFGSLWTLFGKKFTEKWDSPLVVITAAVGGSPIAAWTEGDLLKRVQTSLADYETATGNQPDYYVWFHGESDARLHTPAATYQKHLQKIIETLPQASQNFLLIGKTICRENTQSALYLIEAQQEFARKHAGVTFAYNADTLTAIQLATDSCHLNYSGMETITEALLENIRPITEGSSAFSEE